MTPAAIDQANACPPSEVADTITEWTDADGSLNVAPGDLVLHDGVFELVAAIEPYEDFFGSRFLYVRFEGSEVTPKFSVAEFVAVRRYVTAAALAQVGSTGTVARETGER